MAIGFYIQIRGSFEHNTFFMWKWRSKGRVLSPVSSTIRARFVMTISRARSKVYAWGLHWNAGAGRSYWKKLQTINFLVLYITKNVIRWTKLFGSNRRLRKTNNILEQKYMFVQKEMTSSNYNYSFIPNVPKLSRISKRNSFKYTPIYLALTLKSGYLRSVWPICGEVALEEVRVFYYLTTALFALWVSGFLMEFWCVSEIRA